MKRHPLFFFIILCLALTACGKGQQINGHTTRTAYRSVKTIKERLPIDNKVEFEVAFGTIHESKNLTKSSWILLTAKTLGKSLTWVRKFFNNVNPVAFKATRNIRVGNK